MGESREQDKQPSTTDVKEFIRAFELKRKAVGELGEIYAQRVLAAPFEGTLRSALGLILLPALTNVYYTIRPQSLLSGVMPFAVPVVCLVHYVYTLNRDMQQFALGNDELAEHARRQYDILYEYSYYNSENDKFMDKVHDSREHLK